MLNYYVTSDTYVNDDVSYVSDCVTFFSGYYCTYVDVFHGRKCVLHRTVDICSRNVRPFFFFN